MVAKGSDDEKQDGDGEHDQGEHHEPMRDEAGSRERCFRLGRTPDQRHEGRDAEDEKKGGKDNEQPLAVVANLAAPPRRVGGAEGEQQEKG